jgi:NAD(P)-dependent dehydrogenase (short-subunit alcohol dehydrogenase family)
MLAERGADIAFTFRSNEDAAKVLIAEIEAIGQAATAAPCDLTDPDATQATIDAFAEAHGGIHTLVHAAGPHIPQQHLSTVTPAQYKTALLEEVAAFFNVTHASLPSLRETHGSIVALTTAATRRFPIRDALSSGTKGAVDQLVIALAVEEGRFGIRANSVGPGMLTDGMAARLIASGDLDDAALEVTRRNIPLRRFGTAQDIAEAVCFLASDRARFISGQLLCVDGGYSV